MENTSFNASPSNYINEKLDIVLHELQNSQKNFEENFIKMNKKIDDTFVEVNKKIDDTFVEVNKKIDDTFVKTDKKINDIDKFNSIEHKHIMENIARLDRRITKIQVENMEEHRKTQKLLNSINSAFIKYETEGLDKLRILFDSDIDRKHHQDIYGHEFVKLNDLIAKNSFRISNLEKKNTNKKLISKNPILGSLPCIGFNTIYQM